MSLCRLGHEAKETKTETRGERGGWKGVHSCTLGVAVRLKKSESERGDLGSKLRADSVLLRGASCGDTGTLELVV